MPEIVNEAPLTSAPIGMFTPAVLALPIWVKVLVKVVVPSVNWVSVVAAIASGVRPASNITKTNEIGFLAGISVPLFMAVPY